MALAIALAWSATASTELSAAEPVTASVGPASREQPRLADAIRTSGDADWRSNLSRVQWSFENHDRLAQQSPAASEEVAAGKSQRDPCYVNSPLSTLRAHITTPTGVMPEDVAAQCRATTPAVQDPRMVGGWAGFEKRWSATCMRHRPLYFEEAGAERYGYTPGYCIQPLVSAGHFFATIPTLPYQMFAQPPCQCTYTLGHYRPGSCVPYRSSHWPMHLGAGIAEAAVIVALVALIP
ncbi:MAG: hypothetical protein IH831_10600 [Planctomycetes bacterium]|nr:hypothetical protein [Planctomycetota bacterium]